MTSAIAGIFSGVLGNILTSVFNLWTSKERNKHEREMARIRIDELKAESEANIQELEVEGDIKKELANIESFNLSQRYGNRSLISSEMIEVLLGSKWLFVQILGGILVFFMGLIDMLRAAIRPVITIVLMYITSYITYNHLQILNANTEIMDAAMLAMVFDNVIYLTFTVVGWWFGDRTIGKYIHRK